MRSIVETRPLLERVAGKIAESLYVPRVAVFLQQGAFYRPAYALGYYSTLKTEFREAAVTIEHLRKEPEPARVYFDDAKIPGSTLACPQTSAKISLLLARNCSCHSPSKTSSSASSASAKSAPKSPIPGTDLRLLKSVASQTALALSNAQLTSAIADEISRREKLNREIEIAREVQERLFPQRLPEIAGLDYSGRRGTALGVGGDYYDFLSLPDGSLASPSATSPAKASLLLSPWPAFRLLSALTPCVPVTISPA